MIEIVRRGIKAIERFLGIVLDILVSITFPAIAVLMLLAAWGVFVYAVVEIGKGVIVWLRP